MIDNEYIMIAKMQSELARLRAALAEAEAKIERLRAALDEIINYPGTTLDGWIYVLAHIQSIARAALEREAAND